MRKIEKVFLTFNGVNQGFHSDQNRRLVTTSGADFKNFFFGLNFQKFGLFRHGRRMRKSSGAPQSGKRGLRKQNPRKYFQ